MSEQKHTPGPWESREEKGDERIGILGANQLWVAEAIQCQRGGREQERANARLIAAAPELLEALQPFANFACDEPCACNNCKARAAIAKATGR